MREPRAPARQPAPTPAACRELPAARVTTRDALMLAAMGFAIGPMRALFRDADVDADARSPVFEALVEPATAALMRRAKMR